MSHAWRFLNRTAFIKLIKPCEGVSLQYACKLGQVLLRVFAFSVGRVCKPHRRCSLVTCRAVIANIGPESACLGLAGSWSKHRQRSVVAVQLVRIEYVAAKDL